MRMSGGRFRFRGNVHVWVMIWTALVSLLLGWPSRCVCQTPSDPAVPPVDPGTNANDVPAAVPGNVVRAGEALAVALPGGIAEAVSRVEAYDETGKAVADAAVAENGVAVFSGETLAPGWYQLRYKNTAGESVGSTTAAVLMPFDRPWNPDDNPVGVDLAVSWLAPEDVPDSAAGLVRLARMAGVGWVRDRLRWREIQPDPDTWAETTRYDATAELQKNSGLRVLSVFHDTPAWARSADGSPIDLRHVYRFCAGLSRRFKGRIDAWEPWNEANAGDFGGWPIHRMCAWQKAAYMGFKDGDPAIPVCWQPIGGINTPSQAKGILESGVTPYFDIFTIHSYDWAHSFASLWSNALQAASGKPLWITEIDRGIAGDLSDPLDDLPLDRALLKAKYIPQEYALAMVNGAARVFHFILADYSETHSNNPIRFGLLRRDLTPRPAYVALAVAGRMLAGTACLGLKRFDEAPHLWAVGFRDKDTSRGDTLLMWSERDVDWPERGQTETQYTLPEALRAPLRCVDYLGRDVPVPDRFTGSPVYLMYPRDTLDIWFGTDGGKKEAEPSGTGSPSGVVLEAWFPDAPPQPFPVGWTSEFYPVLRPGVNVMRVAAYNFNKEIEMAGTLKISGLPAGWQADGGDQPIVLPPMERIETEVRITVPEDADPAVQDQPQWIQLRMENATGMQLDCLAVSVRLPDLSGNR